MGSPSADAILGGSGADRISGRGGGDCVRGGAGDDRISGGGGADAISAGAGRNAVSGGGGNDTINAHNRARDEVRCGPGRDRATVDRADRVLGCEVVARR